VQYAWLEQNEGFWRFFIDNTKQEVRRWEDEDIALKELLNEGWIITGPYTAEHDLCARGYGLNRNIH
jgi:hypothetical protein